MELSTPVVELWNNIVALPLIGTLDSARTQVVMENLLKKFVENEAMIAIIDITGCRRSIPGCSASFKDRRGRAFDGRRLHHQRYASADRTNYRASRR